MTIQSPKINADRLWARLETLAEMTEPNRPWTRLSFGDLHIRAREWIGAEMMRTGMSVFTDDAGNFIGELPGSEEQAPFLASGSHLDTVPKGGRFDGMLGVVAALEVAESIVESGIELRHPYRAIDFLAEEPGRYAVSCIGSRAIAGELTDTQLAIEDGDGSTMAQGIRKMGGDPARLGAPLWRPGDCKAFIELHIEQGPLLEQEAIDVGVVTDIVGIKRSRIAFEGVPAHAGTTPMDRRQDALVGAAELIGKIRLRAREANSDDCYFVATVGVVDNSPNGSNVVPGRTELIVEMRSNRAGALQAFARSLNRVAGEIADDNGLTVEIEALSSIDPVSCADEIQDVVENAAAATGYTHIRMSSGAGHDAGHVALVAPAGMIFVPCLEGRSHCPEEWSSKEQVAAGAQVLLDAIVLCDQL